MVTAGLVRTSLAASDLRILNRVREGLSLCPQPFRELAMGLEMDEELLLERLRVLKSNQLLRYIGPIYFAEAYGRGLSLLAISVHPNQLDHVTQTLLQFPEILHIAVCRHHFNVWFTMSEKGLAAREKLREKIAKQTGQTVLHLYSLKEFYPGVRIPQGVDPAAAVLSEFDWRLIGATEQGMPLVAEPWQRVAEEMGGSQDELLVRMQRLIDWGILLRVGGLPDFCRMGLRAAGISVWDIDDAVVERLGALVAEQPYVSQCSLRPRYEPDWPYNLMVFVHGRSRREVRERVAELAQLAGAQCRGQDLLFRAHMIRKNREWPIQGVL